MIASDLGVWENSGPGGVVPQRWVLRISKDKQVREVKWAMTWVPRAPCPCLCPGPVGYTAVPVSSSLPFFPFPCLCVHRHHAVELALSLSFYPDTAVEAALVDGAGGGAGGGGAPCVAFWFY